MLKIVRAILNGERDSATLAALRDRRCKHPAADIATALDGRYRAEYLRLLRTGLALWEAHQTEVSAVDADIASHLRTMRRDSALPPLAAKPRVRGRKPHDPAFDVREALYLRRQRSRLGAPKAVTAAAHKLARIVYHLVRFGGGYVKTSEAEYTAQVRGRLEKSLKRRAAEVGFEVTRKAESPPPAVGAMPPPAGA